LGEKRASRVILFSGGKGTTKRAFWSGKRESAERKAFPWLDKREKGEAGLHERKDHRKKGNSFPGGQLKR